MVSETKLKKAANITVETVMIMTHRLLYLLILFFSIISPNDEMAVQQVKFAA